MARIFKFTTLVVLFLSPSVLTRSSAQINYDVPGESWSRIKNLESAGWSREKLSAAHDFANSIHSSAVAIVQHGKIVDEWGEFDRKISSYSMRKSLMSALYGIYSARGVVDINQTLAQAGIDDSPDPLTQQEKQARIEDLLRARSGVYHLIDFESEGMRKARPARDSHAPGTFWYYNNWDFNALGTILEKKTGLKLGECFYRNIVKPIGMEDFHPDDGYYLGGPLSVHQAYHFEITARDLARFGLLYLNYGRWNGKQIVPEAWVEKSSHASEMIQFNGADSGGYEYLWWVEYGGVHIGEGTLPGMYSAQGAGGHYILVIPSLDMVIVNRVDNDAPVKDSKTVAEVAIRPVVKRAQFGQLVKLILDSRVGLPGEERITP